MLDLNRPFLFDTSGLISVLSGPGPKLQTRKLTQLKEHDMIRDPYSVYLEARQKDTTVKEWVERNRQGVIFSEAADVVRHVNLVRGKCASLTGFLSKVADVMVVCAALELNSQFESRGMEARYVVVALDSQLEAACFTFAIDRLSPNAFVQLFASTDLSQDPKRLL